MGKNPNRQAAAARAAELRAQAARKERQRKQLIAAGVAVVVVIMAVVVGLAIANRPQEPAPAADASASAALSKLTTIPQTTLDAVTQPAGTRVPERLQGGEAMTQDGKPKVLYVGAEFCPFCAMERWALIGALSRFGTFEGLTGTTSGSDHTPADIPTWSFVGSSYTSDHLVFEAVETSDREGKPLETLEGENKTLFEKFNPGGGIPWTLYGGTHAASGTLVGSSVFEDATYDELIAGVLDPTSEIGQAIDPGINVITAQICSLTDNQPADVCTSAGVAAAAPLLAK